MMPCFDGVYYCILRNEVVGEGIKGGRDRKSTRLNSSHSQISYAVFCLKKKSRGVDRPPRGVDVDRPARDPRERLLDDAHGLLHLGHTHEVTREVVAVLLRRDLELEPVV